MAFSAIGKVKVAAHAALFFVNILVLAFSTRVNHFQEFYFMADLFPFGLSIVTLILLTITIALDFAVENSYTGRAQFEIGHFGLLSIFWLAFNSFSTSRWRMIPFQCNSIPSDFSEERGWCKDVQALKGLVWVEFFMCFVTALMTLRYTFTQYSRGNKHIFQMPLSRYHPELLFGQKLTYGRDSEFLQFEKLT
ncbi:hypothetical protein D9615_005493 [Tricholomella constricta]|uniref:MARVEL domain-containing protein n=1 Tax=Tricholomella constricta TaxID=117010 RepID=A0A8H5M5P5_9AGAR|nr:hypothetical protein D9615_005493 [Tricholomella constricta]